MPEHEPKRPRGASVSRELPDIDTQAELAPGTQQVELDHPAAPDAKRAAGFTPSKRQQAYLHAWLDPQAPKTVSGIAKHIDVPRRTITYWLKQDEFMAWFNAQIERETDHLWRPLLLKTAQLGMQGSVEHTKLLAQIRGAIRQDDAPQRGGVTVIVGIPRSGDPVQVPASAPMPQLPPPPSSTEH